MQKHLELGKTGEDIACLYIQEAQYDILGRNVRFGRDEIDIIARDRAEDMIVFIEVKTRTHHSPDYPIRRSVTARKRTALKRAIGQWVEQNDYDGAGRLDVICVSAGRVFEHIKDVGSEVY